MTGLLHVLDWMAALIGVGAALLIVISVLHAVVRLTGWIVQHFAVQHPAGDAAGPRSLSRRLVGLRHDPDDEDLRDFRSIRLGLGRSLVLGLEMLLAAEVIHTVTVVERYSLTPEAVTRSTLWNGIGVVVVTAAIRVLLTSFLGIEIRQEERRTPSAEL